MTQSFNFSQGIDISNADGIHECFHINGDNILANISFENLMPLLRELCKSLKAPLFFFMELPCDEEKEKSLKEKDGGNFHKDIYYLDNCTTSVIQAILKRYGDLLLNDGLVQFGFASHEDEDEIYVTKYKLLNIYSKKINQYADILKKSGIPLEDKIKTVWDNFTSETPGTVSSVEVDGETVYDIVDNLKEAGLYFAETAED